MVARHSDMAADPAEESIFTEVARRRQRSECLRALAPEDAALDSEALIIPADPVVADAPELAEPEAAEAAQGPAESEALSPSPAANELPVEPAPAEGVSEALESPCFEEADQPAPIFDVADLEPQPAAEESGEEEEAPFDFEKIPADLLEKSTPSEAPDVSAFKDLPPPETVRPTPRAHPENHDAQESVPSPTEAEPVAAEPVSPEAPAEDVPEAFAEASDIVSNDLSQPEAASGPGAPAVDAESEDPEIEELRKKTLEALVEPEERERLVEKYAPVVDLQRLPKSKPNRVLQKSKRLSEEAAKPPAETPTGTERASVEKSSDPASPKSKDGGAAHKKKKRVSLLDSYFKGL